MIKFFSKIRFLLTHILPPTTIDLSDGTLKALKGLPGYEKIYLRNNVRTKTLLDLRESSIIQLRQEELIGFLSSIVDLLEKSHHGSKIFFSL